MSAERRPRNEAIDEPDIDDEGSSQPRKKTKAPKNPWAMIAYYVGVASLIPFVGFGLGPVALVLGSLGVANASSHPKGKGMFHSVAGIVLALLGLAVSITFVVLIKKEILNNPLELLRK